MPLVVTCSDHLKQEVGLTHENTNTVPNVRITLKYALKSFTLLLVGGWRAHVFELLINLQFSLPCFPHGDSAHVGQWSTRQMDTKISANMISFLRYML